MRALLSQAGTLGGLAVGRAGLSFSDDLDRMTSGKAQKTAYEIWATSKKACALQDVGHFIWL